MVKKRIMAGEDIISKKIAPYDLIITVRKVSDVKKAKKRKCRKIIKINMNYDNFINFPVFYNFIPGKRGEKYLDYVPLMHSFIVEKLKTRPYVLQDLMSSMQKQDPTWIPAYNYIHQQANNETYEEDDEVRASYISAMENLFEGVETRIIGDLVCVGLTEKLDKP